VAAGRTHLSSSSSLSVYVLLSSPAPFHHLNCSVLELIIDDHQRFLDRLVDVDILRRRVEEHGDFVLFDVLCSFQRNWRVLRPTYGHLLALSCTAYRRYAQLAMPMDAGKLAAGPSGRTVSCPTQGHQSASCPAYTRRTSPDMFKIQEIYSAYHTNWYQIP
jgi:hypothetical protein